MTDDRHQVMWIAYLVQYLTHQIDTKYYNIKQKHGPDVTGYSYIFSNRKKHKTYMWEYSQLLTAMSKLITTYKIIMHLRIQDFIVNKYTSSIQWVKWKDVINRQRNTWPCAGSITQKYKYRHISLQSSCICVQLCLTILSCTVLIQ